MGIRTIELEELADRGIHKECTGLILNINSQYFDFWMKEERENIPNRGRFKERRGEYGVRAFKIFPRRKNKERRRYGHFRL